MWRRTLLSLMVSRTFAHSLKPTCGRCTSREKAVQVESTGLTPQERLAMSRRALVEQLNGREGKPGSFDPGRPRLLPRSSGTDRTVWMPVARNVVKRWWQRHPANAVGQLAIPALE